MQTHRTRLIMVLLFTMAMTLAACNSATNNSGVEPAANEEMENMEDMNHDEDADHEHEESARIPNEEGAAIQLVGPADGTTFTNDEDIIVEVNVEGFALGEEGKHWHIYIDGASWGMVMGQATSQVLRGVDPGEHELAVYLAGGDHIEFEEGDTITITVEE